MSPRRKSRRPHLSLHRSTTRTSEPEPPVTTDEDIERLMGALKREVSRQTMDIADRIGLATEACVRFSPLSIYCRHVRTSRGETVKAAAQALKLPQHVIHKIEEGDVLDLELRAIEKYIEYLGLEGWFGAWVRANDRLVRMLEQPPVVRRSLNSWQLQMIGVAADDAEAAHPASRKGKTARPALQLEIVLEESDPRIWRRIAIAADSTLHQLHRAIQVAMGWTDSHLYAFEIGDRQFSDASILEDPEEFLNSRRFRLSDLAFREGSQFRYRYDFGDDWSHLIRVESVAPAVAEQPLPWCLAGERACPPEDSGGVYGYQEVLDTLGDPRHPEHSDIRGWLPEGFDPGAFDLEGTNRRLTRSGGGNRG